MNCKRIDIELLPYKIYNIDYLENLTKIYNITEEPEKTVYWVSYCIKYRPLWMSEWILQRWRWNDKWIWTEDWIFNDWKI